LLDTTCRIYAFCAGMLLGVFGVERKLYIIHDGLRLATPKIYFHLANVQTNLPAIEVVLDRVCFTFPLDRLALLPA
jgi:hypothetical protein